MVPAAAIKTFGVLYVAVLGGYIVALAVVESPIPKLPAKPRRSRPRLLPEKPCRTPLPAALSARSAVLDPKGCPPYEGASHLKRKCHVAPL